MARLRVGRLAMYGEAKVGLRWASRRGGVAVENSGIGRGFSGT